MKKYQVAIIGCGNIAFLMDDDPLRKEIWTHAKAYRASKRFELVGAADTDPEKALRFADRYRLPAFSSAKDLLRGLRPDVVSICTPAAYHAEGIRVAVAAGVRGIFCEKPLAATAREAAALVALCKRKRVVLQVNHPRRWDDNFRVPARWVRDGKIGALKSVNALYSNKLHDTGTHLFDVLRMLAGEIVSVAGDLHPDKPEPWASGYLRFANGVTGSINAVGKREDMLFEFDLLGTEGRLLLLNNGSKLERFKWAKSRRFSGYRELELADKRTALPHQRMVEAVENLARALDGKETPACSGADGLAAMRLIEAFERSHRRGGAPVRIGKR